MAKAKGQNYIHGAAILTVGVVIMKILGAIYKIPIKNMIGDDGYSMFLSAYNVYNVFLTLATAGLPIALSRLISEANTQGRPMQARRTFSVAWWTFFALGLISSLIMFLFPDTLAGWLHNPDAAKSIWALSPAVLLVCLTSAYRGYCQGFENMIPTTVGQVLEVLVKVVVGLLLAWYLLHIGQDKPTASAGAIFGVTAGSLAALVYMWTVKKRQYPYEPVAEPDVPENSGRILKKLLSIGIPIALGSSVLSFMNLLDSGQCMARLQNAAGFSYEDSQVLYGVYGAAQTLFNLPAAFITPLTISVVPAIAAALTRGDRLGADKISEDSLRIATVLCLPMGVGLSVLASPIMHVIYPDSHEAGGMLLCLLGIASFFVCFVLIQNAILQASGRERYPVYSMIVGSIVKVAVNWFLVGMPSVNIFGAPIGTLCSYFSMAAMNHIFMCRSTEHKPRLSVIIPRPALVCAVMGAVAFGGYRLCELVIGTGSRLHTVLCLGISIFAAVAVYLIATVALRTITAEDMKLIPKGDKLAKLLHMR